MLALVVVDMQPRFGCSQVDWMIENVSREIRAAKKAGHVIIFLEYTDGINGGTGVSVKDATDRRLIDLVSDYDRALVVHKSVRDGSKKVSTVLVGYYMSGRNDIRVVGVETPVCVAETVNGLAKAMPAAKITVVGDACNSGDGNFPYPHTYGQERIETRANVEILQGVGPFTLA